MASQTDYADIRNSYELEADNRILKLQNEDLEDKCAKLLAELVQLQDVHRKELYLKSKEQARFDKVVGDNTYLVNECKEIKIEKQKLALQLGGPQAEGTAMIELQTHEYLQSQHELLRIQLRICEKKCEVLTRERDQTRTTIQKLAESFFK